MELLLTFLYKVLMKRKETAKKFNTLKTKHVTFANFLSTKAANVQYNLILNEIIQFVLVSFTQTNPGRFGPGSLNGSAVITHGETTGTGYCLVGFNWIIDFLN